MKKILFLFCLLLFSTSAFAIGVIELDKTKVRLSIPPGSSKSGYINIDNPSGETKHIRVYLEDWKYTSQEGSKEFLPAGSTDISAAPWINFLPVELTMPAYSKQRLSYTVKVPANAQGGHYAIMFFEVGEPSKASEGIALNLAVRMGCLFYIEPEGTIKKFHQLYDFSVQRNASGGGIDLGLSFQNTGNVDITCGGTFDIIDKRGKVYARGEFSRGYTLPGDKARLSASWKKPLPAGKYDAIITLDLGKALEELQLGRGPIVVKESEIEIGAEGEVIKIGPLR
jgi:P pilus assembly chaperone PapD